MKLAVQLDLSLDHVPGAAAESGGALSVNKQKKSIPRQERVDAEFFLSLVSINSPLNYVIWRALSVFFHVRECYE